MLAELGKLALDILKSRKLKPIYVVLSGSHAYGFPSPNSDFDIRCCHAVQTKELFRLTKPKDIFECSTELKGRKVDIVSYEIEKALWLAIKNNSNILENIFSKALFSSKEHAQLAAFAKALLSKAVWHPYKGMAVQNYKKFIERKHEVPVKAYLYVLRSYMAGIWALKFGSIQPNTVKMNKYFKLDVVEKLIKLKCKGENVIVKKMEAAELAIKRLSQLLEQARAESRLPEFPSKELISKAEDWLIKLRLANLCQ